MTMGGEGGGADLAQRPQRRHVVGGAAAAGLVAHLVQAHQQGERHAARHTELLLVDELEQSALVELRSPLQIAGQLAPAAVQQPQHRHAVAAERVHQPVDAAPGSLQRLEGGVVQQSVAGARQSLVQGGELPVDHAAETAGVGADQPVEAEPEAQGVGGVGPQEGVDLGEAGLGAHRIADSSAQGRTGGPLRVAPRLPERLRMAAVGGHAFWGMRATRRSDAVSSSICSQGRR